MNKLGLGGILFFDEKKAVVGVGKARDEFGRFVNTSNRIPMSMQGVGMAVSKVAGKVTGMAKQVGAAVDKMGGALRGVSLAALPITMALGLGTNAAADFEEKMSHVASAVGADEAALLRLTSKAEDMGIQSAFSAAQSAEAMENLARAGATTDEIISGLSGVMNAAAADSIDLATSSDIISQVVRGMNLEFSQAGHVADVLSKTSQATNTDIISLGDTFRYGSAEAMALGVSLEETAALFGKLADSGLRGSIGGTAFTNMMAKLAKPSKEGAAMLEKWRVKLTDASGKLRPVSSIIEDVAKQVNKIPDAAERAATVTELFGERGKKAYSALAAAGKESIDKLQTELEGSSFGMGVAAEAAEKRLDNLKGRVTLLASSVEAFAIQVLGPMLGMASSRLDTLTTALNKVLGGLRALKDAGLAERIEMEAGGAALAKTAAERLRFMGVSKDYVRQSGAVLGVLGRMAVGEEKLSEAQRVARGESFREWFRAKHTQEELADKGVQAELARVDAVIAAATRQGASAEAQAELRKRVMGEIAKASERKGGLMDPAKQGEQLAALMAEEAQRKRTGAAAIAQAQRQLELLKIEQEHGKGVLAVVMGIEDGINFVKAAWRDAVGLFQQAGGELTKHLGPDTVRTIAKVAVAGGIIVGALAPALGVMGAIVLAIKAIVVPAVTGLAGLLGGLFWPVVLGVGIAIAAFQMVRRENETVGETVSRVWGVVKETVLSVWNDAVKPFFVSLWETVGPVMAFLWDSFKGAWQSIGGALGDLWDSFSGLFGLIFSGGAETAGVWGTTAGVIIDVIAFAISSAVSIIGGLLTFLIRTAAFVIDVLTYPFQLFDQKLRQTLDTLLVFMEGDIVGGFARVGASILDAVLTPVQLIAKALVKLGTMADFDTPQWMKDFAHKGVYGMLFEPGEVPTAKVAAAVSGATEKERAQAATLAGQKDGDTASEIDRLTGQIAQMQATQRGEAAKPPEVKTQVQVDLKDERKLEVNNKLSLNGRDLALATSKHQQEIQERSGFKATPWQRRLAVEHGAPGAATGTGG